MTINQVIITALSALSIPCEPDTNTIDATEYLTFNYFTNGECFGSGKVWLERYNAQIHYCCPSGYNCLSKLAQIKSLLFAGGFSWPGMTDESDIYGQRWVFECDYLMEAG